MGTRSKRLNGRKVTLAVGSAALALGVASPVSATLQMAFTVYDTVTPTIGYSNVFVDGGMGDTDGLVNQQITLGAGFAPIPNVSITGAFSTAKVDGQNLLTGGSTTITNSRATTTRVYVAVGDTAFTPPATKVQVAGDGTLTNPVGATGSTVTLNYYNDPANEQGANRAFADLADFLGNADLLTPGNLVDSFAATNSFSYDNISVLANPDLATFSMTMLFDVSLISGAQLGSFTMSMLKSVPEPATLALFSLGLAGIGVARRKKLAA